LKPRNYWIRRSFKVNVTKAEKRTIGKHSIPRPEIDLLAFHYDQNEVLALEVKSLLDSPGVKLAALQLQHDVPEGKYKLFTCERYRTVVLSRLFQDLIDAGMANSQTKVRLGLVAGKVYRGQSADVRAHMTRNNWFFWSPCTLALGVRRVLADRGRCQSAVMQPAHCGPERSDDTISGVRLQCMGRDAATRGPTHD